MRRFRRLSGIYRVQRVDEPDCNALRLGRANIRHRKERPHQSLRLIVGSEPSVFADIRSEVYNFWDRGLLGFALDPSFPGTPYVYALYSYDSPLGGAAPHWGTAAQRQIHARRRRGRTSYGCVISARLSRIGGPPGPAYQAEVLADGPAGYWRLGEASGTIAADASPSANFGAYVGGPTLGAAAPLVADSSNRAVAFNATSYVNVPDSPSVSFTGAFTLEPGSGSSRWDSRA